MVNSQAFLYIGPALVCLSGLTHPHTKEREDSPTADIRQTSVSATEGLIAFSHSVFSLSPDHVIDWAEETTKRREYSVADAARAHRVLLGRQTGALTLVVVDDKPDFRAVLRSLSVELGLKIIGECSDWRSALTVLRQSKPAIAIVDVHLPILNGIEIIRTMHQEIPQMRFIASTGHALDEMFDVAMKSGTSAFALKTDLIREFRDVIATVVGGHRYVSRAALERLLDRHIEMVQPAREANSLTARQCSVVGLVARGCSNKEVAVRLNISESTVEKHRAAAMHRLGLQTSADLVRYAIAAGLVNLKSGADN